MAWRDPSATMWRLFARGAAAQLEVLHQPDVRAMGRL
jgi:hypothetical protein